MKKLFPALLGVSVFFCLSWAQADLRLEMGSYLNRTHIDTGNATANLNFVYTGCDPNPSYSKIRLKTGSCVDVNEYDVQNSMGKTATSGAVGQIFASYDGDNQTCAKKTRAKINVRRSLRDMYKEFQKKGCTPTHLVIRESDKEGSLGIDKAMINKRICELPPAKITKKGFPTEMSKIFNLTATDRGFKIGDHTSYQFDHNRKVWCVSHNSKDGKSEKCGDWPSPIPMPYKTCKDCEEIHVNGTISLTPDGKAQIRAIDKTYPNRAAMFEDQLKGGLTQTIPDKGRIEFHTWRKDNGNVRAIVRSYEKDTKFGKHERSVNFFGRNLFGIGITKSWCPKEHCFAGVTTEKLKPNACSQTPEVDMANGGDGNLCHSCLGMMPGQCAVKPTEVAMVKGNLIEDNSFRLLQNGEYRMGLSAEKGLLKNYQRIVESPANPGCHPGHAPSFEELFEPDPVFSGEGRSIQKKDESL